MKRNRSLLAIHLAGTLLLAAPLAAAEPGARNSDGTNRVAVSFRLGFGISAKFKGIGGSLQPSAPAAHGRRTPDGDAYNYDDGYLLTDVSGNFGDQTWYWGYDNSSQVSGDNILLHRTTAPGLPSSGSADADPYPGVEITFNRQLGIKENWRGMRYGLEGAASYLPICLSLNTRFAGNLTRTTDTYAFTPGTTPPSAPYQGTFDGPGFVIDSNPSSSVTSFIPGTVVERDSFDANLFGFRLGPYVEFPVNERLSVHLSAGLAIGLLQSSASWNQTIDISGEGIIALRGSRDSFDILFGPYASAEAAWALNDRWSVHGGLQFQNLGKYNQNLGFRKVELDLSRSLFVVVGVGYSF